MQKELLGTAVSPGLGHKSFPRRGALGVAVALTSLLAAAGEAFMGHSSFREKYLRNVIEDGLNLALGGREHKERVMGIRVSYVHLIRGLMSQAEMCG